MQSRVAWGGGSPCQGDWFFGNYHQYWGLGVGCTNAHVDSWPVTNCPDPAFVILSTEPITTLTPDRSPGQAPAVVRLPGSGSGKRGLEPDPHREDGGTELMASATQGPSRGGFSNISVFRVRGWNSFHSPGFQILTFSKAVSGRQDQLSGRSLAKSTQLSP